MQTLHTPPHSPSTSRLRVVVRGAVQGVGFRPFVYRLARQLDLSGWVLNNGDGVRLEVEGPREGLEQFLLALADQPPPRAFIQSIEPVWLDPAGLEAFTIRPSEGGVPTALVLPDLATCPDCRRELFDPADRRYRHPFVNCTQCGPRFSILHALPYDRPNTTMRGFALCPACRAEYDDPADRRFHAQPVACPACGPRLAFRDAAGTETARDHAALDAAMQALDAGQIVALKGLGGFQFMADACNPAAVARLRAAKRRATKPFALMVATLDDARRLCAVGPLEARLLTAPEAPIVLLERRVDPLAPLPVEAVAPGNPALGLMLPTTPLHHLLATGAGRPLVATSGNRAEEPLCTDEHEAITRLAGLADCFLVHDRPIERHVDDSIVRVMGGRESVMRRARGYAPLPLSLPGSLGAPLLPLVAVGAQLKNVVALARGHTVFLSQHIGDLETPESLRAFRRVIADLGRLLAITPQRAVCDAHPDYVSTREAEALGLPLLRVQHHYAHALACMAENELTPPLLAVVWDGAGWGPDGTVWGGEFLLIEECGWRRIAHLRPFRLPGGEAAVHEPRRAALGVLASSDEPACVFRAHGPLACLQSFPPAGRANLETMLARGLNSPWTSSMGRLFDAVAAVLGVRTINEYEGQAAMELEWAARRAPRSEVFGPMRWTSSPAAHGLPLTIDAAGPLAVLARRVGAQPPDAAATAALALGFHEACADIIAEAAARFGTRRIALTGGCFQNRLLLDLTLARLREAGVQPYWHQRVPPGDGGIALGQAVAAARHEPDDQGAWQCV